MDFENIYHWVDIEKFTSTNKKTNPSAKTEK